MRVTKADIRAIDALKKPRAMVETRQKISLSYFYPIWFIENPILTEGFFND